MLREERHKQLENLQYLQTKGWGKKPKQLTNFQHFQSCWDGLLSNYVLHSGHECPSQTPEARTSILSVESLPQLFLIGTSELHDL